MRVRNKRLLTLLGILLFPFGALGGVQNSVTVGFTFSMPPYLSDDKQGGIEREIIAEAFKSAGIETVNVENVHYLRAIELAKSGAIDVIASNRSNEAYDKNMPKAAASDTTISYVDCAISLQDKNFQLNTIEDYYDKRIWAFKSASLTLGAEFQTMTQRNPDYTENTDQLKQLEMLAKGRIDVAISDRNIFAESQRRNHKYAGYGFKYDSLSPATPRIIRSLNDKLIKRFNEGLTELKASGKYQSIMDKYALSYYPNCD